MRFLCLPGAYGSAKNFKIQLGPLAQELERRGVATFAYSQGKFETEPPPGWEDYFGQRPLYRFLDTSRGDAFEGFRKLRFIPRSLNPEDLMRMFQGSNEGEEWHQKAWQDTLDGVNRSIAEDPEIDGIIGYSEGAMVGASVVVDEARKWEQLGIPRRIKFAMFISGAPPLKFDGDKKIVTQLSDEVGEVISIPTFHIFGCDDAFLSCAIALSNVCNQERSHLYDHGLGHIVPRDAENVERLGNVLQELITKYEAEALENPEMAKEFAKPTVNVESREAGLKFAV